MVDMATRFFEDLDRRGFEPLLVKTSGTLRFDLHEGPHTTHWLLEIDRGNLRVRQEDGEADTVVGTEPAPLRRAGRRSRRTPSRRCCAAT